jgi:2-aminoadipate transaminase
VHQGRGGFRIDSHIRKIREVYGRRRNLAISALERELPEGVRFTRPQGGLFLWIELPQSINARELLTRYLERNVAFVPGGSFFPNGGHEHTMRINFSNMPDEKVEMGLSILGEEIRRMVERKN